jgi:hypothetical protein
MSPDMIL